MKQATTQKNKERNENENENESIRQLKDKNPNFELFRSWDWSSFMSTFIVFIWKIGFGYFSTPIFRISRNKILHCLSTHPKMECLEVKSVKKETTKTSNFHYVCKTASTKAIYLTIGNLNISRKSQINLKGKWKSRLPMMLRIYHPLRYFAQCHPIVEHFAMENRNCSLLWDEPWA